MNVKAKEIKDTINEKELANPHQIKIKESKKDKFKKIVKIT